MTSTGTVGSPYSGGMASPYSDLSVGVPSPPTVVTDYNRSMDVVNTDGPHLVVVEQPQSKFRFRYKSEMVGTHGQLKAERADRNKAIFPTVKLMNWRDGPAVIRLALYTGEDNFNQRRRHVHELSGKNCDRDTGMCEMVVDQNTDYTASFQNLGIIHIAKRDVKDIIKQRKKTELIEHAKMRQPHRSLEEIRHSITPTDMKKFDEDAEEIAKMMDLNKVVLRFQAFHYDTSADCYRTLTRPVDSELVVNLKNASTGELKIVRMSDCSAPSTGGTEVWMLVEKVKKNNIKIKFYEQDSDYKEVWSAYGEFNESDVHHQYAIIFRTPPYRTTNLRSSVRVKVQLERPNDKDTSEPRDFTYYPESRKRQIPFMETAKLGEDEDYSNGGNRRSKRPCHGSSEPLDLTYSDNGNCPIDSIMTVLQGNTGEYTSGLTLQQSPQYTVPSPNHPGASPNSNSSDKSFYQATDMGNSNSASGDNLQFQQVPSNDQIQVMVGNNPPFLISTTNGVTREASMTPEYNQVASPNQMSSPQYQAPSPQLSNYQQTPSPSYQQSPSPSYQQVSSPSYQQIPSPSYQQSSSPSYQQVSCSPSRQPPQHQTTTASAGTLFGGQFIGVGDQMVPRSPNGQLNGGRDIVSGGETSMLSSNMQSMGMMMPGANQQILQQQQHQFQTNSMLQHNQGLQINQLRAGAQQHLSIPQMGGFTAPSISMQQNNAGSTSETEWNFSNLLSNNDNPLGAFDLEDSISLENINPDLFSISDLQTDSAKEKGQKKVPSDKPEGKSMKPCQLKSQMCSVEQLTKSLGAVNISEKYKLESLKPFMKQDVIPGSVDVAFLVAISAAESLQAYAATGDLGRLLATHRYLLAVQNNQGDNALHTAVGNKNWDAFNKILTAALNLRPSELLNTQNYLGETPLHQAVRAGELSMAERLVSCAGSDISIPDRNGNTTLHLAAALPPGRVATDIMTRLLTRPVNGARSRVEAALQAYNYQGETALHVAVIHNNLPAVRLMVQAGAVVHLCERKRGANSLHLAAQHHCLHVAEYLIQHTKITVNSRMFDGNTALHIAAQEGDASMCAVLMKAGADPKAKNSLRIRKKKVSASDSDDANEVDEEEDGDEDGEEESEEDIDEDPDCYTPIDYAAKNTEVLAILHGHSSGPEPLTPDPTSDADSKDGIMDSGIDI